MFVQQQILSDEQLMKYSYLNYSTKALKSQLTIIMRRPNQMTEPTKPLEQSAQHTPPEQLPLSSFYKVLDHVTIFRSEKWWEAIVVIESFGRRSIAMYLWTKKGD